MLKLFVCVTTLDIHVGLSDEIEKRKTKTLLIEIIKMSNTKN